MTILAFGAYLGYYYHTLNYAPGGHEQRSYLVRLATLIPFFLPLLLHFIPIQSQLLSLLINYCLPFFLCPYLLFAWYDRLMDRTVTEDYQQMDGIKVIEL